MEPTSRDPARPDREEQALAEMAATRVGRAVAVLLLGAFLTTIATGLATEIWALNRAVTLVGQREPLLVPTTSALAASWRARGLAGVNLQLMQFIGSADRRVRLESVFTRLLGPPIQGWFAVALGYGNGRVVVGRDGWLFLDQALDADVGPPFLDPATLRRRSGPEARVYPAPDPDPIPGLLALHRQLRRRQVQLVVMPIPEKEQIYPGQLRSARWTSPPRNASYGEFVDRLRSAGLCVYDPAGELFARALDGDLLYLPTDTHWSPAGLELAARGLAEFLRRNLVLPPSSSAGLTRKTVRVELPGDLTRLLSVVDGASPYPPLAIDLDVVHRPDGRRLDAHEGLAPIVVLGDSFSMIFSKWAGKLSGAGFGEQLSFQLGQPVRVLSGARHSDLADRMRWLREEPGLLRQTRIVIYAFATRQLSVRTWAPIQLDAGGRKAPAGGAGQRNRRGKVRAPAP